MVTVTQSGQTFTQPQQLAQFWLERKLSGRRIVTVPQRPTLEQDKFWREARTEYAKLRAKPDIRRKFEARVLRRAKPVTTPTAKPTEIPKARPKVDFPEQVKREEIPKFKKLLPIVAKTGERLSIPERAYNLAVSEYNKGVERNDIKRIDRAGFALEAIDKSQIVDKPELTEQEEKRFKRTLGKLKKLPTRDLRGDAVFLQKGVIEKLDLPVRDTGEKRFTPQELFERQMAEQQRIVTTPRVTDELLLGERMLTVEQPSQGTFPKTSTFLTTDIEAKEVGAVDFVRKTFIPALTLDSELYLPDSESRQKYIKLLESSDISKGKFSGGRLQKFINERQAQEKRDIAKYNAESITAQGIIEGREFKETEQELKDLTEQLNTIASKETITQDDIDNYNNIKSVYDKTSEKYNTLYGNYKKAFNQAEKSRLTINRGRLGTGWDVLYEEANKRGGLSRVQALALEGGVTAYKVGEKVLIYQAGASVVGGLLGTTATGAGILKTIDKPLRIIGSKKVIIPAGITGASFTGVRQAISTGDPYRGVAVGLGTAAGFFGSVYSKPIVETGIKVGKATITELGKAPAFRPGEARLKRAEMELFARTKSKYGVDFTKKVYTKAQVEKARRDILRLSKEDQVRLFRESYKKFLNSPKSLIPEEVDKYFKFANSVFRKQIIDIVLRTTATKLPKEYDLVLEQASQSPFYGTGQYEITGYTSPALTASKVSSPTTNFGFTTTPLNTQSEALSSLNSGYINTLSRDVGTFALFSAPSYQQTNLIDAKTFQQQYQSNLLSLGLVSDTGVTTDTATDVRTDTRELFGTPTVTEKVPVTEQVPVTGFPRTVFRPPTRPPRAPRLPDIDLPEFKGKKKIETVPYNAEYLPAGQVKYKRINKKPQTLRSALSTMARKVDETLSNRGRVRKTKPIKTKKGKIVPVVDTKDPYFQNNQFKFRTFDTVRGRRVALPKGNYIERRAFRNDTRGERVSRNKGRRTPFGF